MARPESSRRAAPTATPGRPRARQAVNGAVVHGVDLGVLSSLLGYQLRLA